MFLNRLDFRSRTLPHSLVAVSVATTANHDTSVCTLIRKRKQEFIMMAIAIAIVIVM
jgi:hypothetical protein